MLTPLIQDLRTEILRGGLTERSVGVAIDRLAPIRVYHDDRFPQLPDMAFEDNCGAAPQNLAEALLWKLGKWNVYQTFVANYHAEDPTPTQTNVVLFAFARHLRDRSNPIYDQHAIRALWAIDGEMRNEECELKSLLFDGNNRWKTTGSGAHTINCYNLFLRRIAAILSRTDPPALDNLDRLLMPLGQTIKRATGTYAEFRKLCGWPD